MGILEEMITHMSPDKCRRFRATMSEKSFAKNELKLFDEIAKQGKKSRKDLMSALYGKVKKRNAFDNVRKRLIDFLIDFVVWNQAVNVNEPRAQVLRLMSAAYTFRSELAWNSVLHFSTKAEKIAVKNKMYIFLEGIYDFWVQNAASLKLKISFETLMKKRDANKIIVDRMRKLIESEAEIELELHRAKRNGTLINVQEIFDKVTAKIQLTPKEKLEPSFRLRITRIFRAALLSVKQYNEVEKLVMKVYNDLNKAKAFGVKESEEEQTLIYMVAHAKYRNKKFEEADKWVDKLIERLPPRTWVTNPNYLKGLALRAAIYTYTGNNQKAIDSLSNLRKSRPLNSHMKEWLNIDLSLSVYHFNAGEYNKTIQLLNGLRKLDYDLKDTMGPEWCYKMDMIEMITHYDRKNIELAIQLHSRIKRDYSGEMDKNKYANAWMFHKVIGKVITKPELVKSQAFRTSLKKMIQDWEVDMTDLQAVTFFCRLKALLHGEDYYKVLMTEVGTKL